MEQTAQTVLSVRRSAPYKVGRFTVIKEWLEPVQCFAESLDVDIARVSLSVSIEAPTTPTTVSTATDDFQASKLSDLPSPVASCCSLTSEEPKQQHPQLVMKQKKQKTTKTSKNDDASLAPMTRTSSARKALNVAETKLRCLSRSSSSASTSAGSDFKSLDTETDLLPLVASP